MRDRVLVIGGGAAGLAAAAAAASCGDSVTVLERMDRAGRKLLATGNGRCNLMNRGELKYRGGADFARAVLFFCGVPEQERFWADLGLRLCEESEGRVYPASLRAATVLDVLMLALDREGVTVVPDAAVTALSRRRNLWHADTARGGFEAERVIVAGGGMAQEKLGSNGSCYALLTSQGHRLVPPAPALTQIETDTAPIRGLEGIRVRAEVTVDRNGTELARESGEVLLTDYGVSGICAMQCARAAGRGCVLHLNLAPGLGYSGPAEIAEDLRIRRQVRAAQPADRLLTGLMAHRLELAVLRAAGVKAAHRVCGELTDRELAAAARTLTDFRLNVTGIRGFSSAQVTAGGIAAEDFEPSCLRSRLAPGLHAAGEVLDVDGDCGGFNLMFAFGSGILAGLNGRNSAYRRENA